MNRFLRRYSKWILAVFGTLLMVVFLVPQAIDAAAQRAAAGTATWAEVDGERVPDERFRRTAMELNAFDRVGGVNAGPAGRVEEPAHWFLLSREAELAGFVPRQGSDMMSQDQILQTFAVLGGRNQVTEQATAHMRGVDNLLQVFAGAAHMSDRRAAGLMRRLMHEVDARLVVLEADAAGAPEPTADEIRAHFEQYRDVAPGEGEYGFGYRLPDRFTLEVLRVPADAIRSMVERSGEVNNISLLEHWYENRDDTALPTFDEELESIPGEVREDLIRTLMEERTSQMRTLVTGRLGEARRDLETEIESAYYVVPEDWAARRTGFESIADTLEETFDGLPRPTYERIDDFMTFEELQARSDLSAAFTDRYGSFLRLGDLIRMHRSLDGGTTLALQQGVAGPILDDGAGGLLVFRVLDTDPARPPRDLAEVGDVPARDLRRLARYRDLQSRLGDVETRARDEGLLALALSEGTQVHEATRIGRYNASLLRFQLQQGMSPQAMPSPLPVLGDAPDAVETLIGHALEAGATTPPDQMPAEQRIFAFESPDRLAIVVAELVRQNPVDRATADMLAGMPGLATMLLRADLEEIEDEAYAEAFSEAALKRRHDFRALDRTGEIEETGASDAETSD